MLFWLLAASAAFTASLTLLPSALPAIFGIRAFITAPIPFASVAPVSSTASCASRASSSSVSWRGRNDSRMPISASSFCASSGRPPPRNWAAESLRCLMSVCATCTTSASESSLSTSISRYLSALFSMRSVPSRCLSRAFAASFSSSSIRWINMRKAAAPSRKSGPEERGARAGNEGRYELHHPFSCLLQRALLRRERLLLALDRRLLVVLALADLAQDPRLLALLLEALHGVLERLAFLHTHTRHRLVLTTFLAQSFRASNARGNGAVYVRVRHCQRDAALRWRSA